MPARLQLIDATALKDLIDRAEPLQLIDVREPEEVAICRIPGAKHVPMQQTQQRLGELDPAVPTVVYCHHGMRSQMVGSYLLQQGFQSVANLVGGIDAYAEAVDPGMARY